MDLTWPSNVSNPESWTYYQVQIPVMAYMDDTIFIDSSKKRIQSTINLATEFYDLNDIFINGNKCDLVVINSQLPTVDRTITIGQQKTKDRKSTRLNSSHTVISYAVFCLKKKINMS